MLSLILFFVFFLISFCLRSDIDNTHYMNGTNDLVTGVCANATLMDPVFCPDDMWAYGYQLLTSTNFGVLNIIIECRNQTFSPNSSMSISSKIFTGYENLQVTYSNFTYCNGDNGKDFISGFSLKMFCPTIFSTFSYGILEISMNCISGNKIITDYTNSQTSYTWSNNSYCNGGSAVCGYYLKYLPNITEYNVSAIDLSFECCDICDVENGFLLNKTSMICEFCDITCKQCYEIASNCTLCNNGYTLFGNTCVRDSKSNEIITKEFFSNVGFIEDWNISGTIVMTSCSPFDFYGGVHSFTQGNWMSRSFDNLPPHYGISIQFYVFKIGNWNYGYLKIIINYVTISYNWDETNYSIYYGQDCGEGNFLYNTEMMYFYFSHKSPSLKINISLEDNAGIAAINRFVVITDNCDPSCFSCTGEAVNQCISCSILLFLTPNSTCVNECPPLYYGNLTESKCLKCDSSCLNCSGGNSSYCLSCNTGFYLQLSNSPSNCLNSCIIGYYPDNQTNTCELCYFLCESCSDSSNSSCFSCKNETFLLVPPGPSYCSSTCLNGYYKNYLMKQCIRCDLSCQTCIQPGSSNCTSCSAPYYLNKGICLMDCPSMTFMNNQTRDCSDCDQSCENCSDFHNYSCITCKTDMFLQRSIIPTSCGSTCEEGYYPNISIKQCEKCNESCQSCSNYNNCTKCNSSLFLHISLIGNSTCEFSCSIGYYPNLQTRQCMICNDSCLTCSDSGNNSCISCHEGKYLENGFCLFCDNPNCCEETQFYLNYSCFYHCPDNYFGINRLCLSCDTSCKTCNQLSNKNCLSCSEPLYLTQGMCLQECPLYAYKNNVTRTCTECHYSCDSCQDSNNLSCTSCDNKTRVFSAVNYNQQYFFYEGMCLCIPSYYDINFNHYCFGNLVYIIYLYLMEF